MDVFEANSKRIARGACGLYSHVSKELAGWRPRALVGNPEWSMCPACLRSTQWISVAQLDPMLFLVVSEIIDIIDETCRRLKHPPPCLQAFLNDLPGNDFNAIFKHLLRCFYERVEIEKGKNKCFVTGVAGSFYGRLFPPNSLHFVHSSYAIMWIHTYIHTYIHSFMGMKYG
ncbi:probable jasmonic acid carboxyl methyltransferase 1 [Gossypium hirsutum]|uniref:Probable jasmonic acid carboxyl methyltransferase 1 n=1 Tax=Gossypium hirsutum TaxID=3635 RepID=A0A1U8LMT8_GOSHI|nr:probable jasmonic acid carboxyl methyltransferase 1 [Gossypium hirsutum]